MLDMKVLFVRFFQCASPFLFVGGGAALSSITSDGRMKTIYLYKFMVKRSACLQRDKIKVAGYARRKVSGQ